MKNPFESLNTLFKSEKPPERRLIRHPQEREIIDIALANLSESALGRQLVNFVRDGNVKISALRGQYLRDFSPTEKSIYISVTKNTAIDDPENAINLIAAIRGAAQEYEPTLKTIPLENGETIYVQREEKKLSDILQWQAKIVYELGKTANKTEFIDSFTIMGYSSLIGAYEKDLENKPE